MRVRLLVDRVVGLAALLVLWGAPTDAWRGLAAVVGVAVSVDSLVQLRRSTRSPS